MTGSRVPFMRLAPGEDRPAVEEAIRRVIDRGWYVLGPEVESFEQAFAAAAGAAFASCWFVNFFSAETELAVIAAIACLYAAQLALPRRDELRLFDSLLATALATGLLYFEVSGSVLTVAWGVQGLALLACGFPLRDRALRLSGLALLMLCILKLFIYDLSYLDTLPRIFSFIALGVILVGVSWIYTRFRERIQRYL